MATNSVLTITIADIDPAASVKLRTIAGAEHPGKLESTHRELNMLVRYLSEIASGNRQVRVLTFMDAGDGTAAHGTIVLDYDAAAAANSTITVAGVVFTARASGASTAVLDAEFNVGSSDTACGDNFAAAVNAHPVLAGMLAAVNVTGTVTLTATDKGTHGNLIVCATSNTNLATITQMASGAKGTVADQMRVWRRGR